MSESCKDTNIPSVDETALECCEIHSTNCIVTAEAVPCLKTGKGATLTKLFSNLCIVIKDIYSKLSKCDGFTVAVSEGLSELTATPTGGLAPYTYTWSVVHSGSGHSIDGVSNTSTISTTKNVGQSVNMSDGLNRQYSTLFKVLVVDSNGCRKEEYFMFSESELIA